MNLSWDTANRLIPVVHKTSAPETTDAAYRVPTLWLDDTADVAYLLVDVTSGVATWRQLQTNISNMTTSTDPAANAATTAAIVAAYSGVIITTTTTGNSQTIASPAVTTAGRTFTVVNNDTSTNSIPIVANSVTFTVTPGEAQMFLWDGTAWGPIDMGITEIPVPVTQGGTGRSTGTTANSLVATGTTATGAQQTLANGATTEVLVGGGASALPVWTTATGSGAPVRATSPTLAGTPLTSTPSDNTSTTQIANTAFAKSQDAVLAREPDQGVAMTYAASGSSGITVADNDNIDFGTGNFTLCWKGSFSDWKVAGYRIISKRVDLSGCELYLSDAGDGTLVLFKTKTGGLGYEVIPSSIAPSIINGTIAEVVVSVNRSVGVIFYVNGVQLGNVVSNTDATDLSTSGPLYILGNSSTRYASTTHHAYTFNRTLTAAEVLHNYRSGPKLEWFDPTGVSPASQTALTSGTLVTGKEYTIDTFVAGDDFANVGGTNVSGNTFVATGTTPTTWTNSSSLRRTGITWGIMPEGMQPAPGQCFDFSGNKLHAMQPATGSSLTRFKKDFEYRWTNTWTASSAAQYVGGLNQAVLSADHFITDVITQATVTTDVENLTLGDGSAVAKFVAAFTPSATRTKQTIAAQNDGTNLKLVYTPAAEATMTVETIIRGFIWEN